MTTDGHFISAAEGWSFGELIRCYAHAVPTAAVIDRIAGSGPLVELDAGAGYWARLRSERGADVVAYDRTRQAATRG